VLLLAQAVTEDTGSLAFSADVTGCWVGSCAPLAIPIIITNQTSDHRSQRAGNTPHQGSSTTAYAHRDLLATGILARDSQELRILALACMLAEVG